MASTTPSSSRLPKRSKRRGGGGGVGGASRPMQLEQVPAQSYTDADQALEAGTQLEEKAERFALGEKAQRYNDLALQVYLRALHLLQRQQQHGNGEALVSSSSAGVADAAYNAARVLYVLATTFTLSNESLAQLQEAERLYTLARINTPSTGDDGLPTPFHLDVTFNLGATLLVHAEQDQVFSTDEAQVVHLARSAMACFDAVLQGQKHVLEEQLRQEQENSHAEIDRPPLPQDEEDLGESGQDNGEAQHADAQRAEYTSSLITPASALETISYLHSCIVLLLDCGADSSEVNTLANVGQGYLAEAQALHSAFPDGDRRSPDNEWHESVSRLQFAQLELQVAVLDTGIESGDIAAIANLAEVLASAQVEGKTLLDSTAQSLDLTTTSGRAQHRLRTERVVQLGDLLSSLLRLLIQSMQKGLARDVDVGIASDVLKAGWNVGTLASKLLLAALQALDASASAGNAGSTVLGGSGLGSAQELITTSSPTLRQRCAIYSSLSTLSVSRRAVAMLAAEARMAIAGVDDATLRTLCDNARVYARKGLAEVGLTILLQPLLPAHNIPLQYKRPHGGLDSIQTECDAVLALLLALATRFAAFASDDSMAHAAMTEAESVCARLCGHGLVATRDQARKTTVSAWRACLGVLDLAASSPSGWNGQSVYEQATGYSSDVLPSDAEQQFWARIEWLLAKAD